MLDLALGPQLFINSEIEAFLLEIDIIFNTNKCELLGHPDFGSNFEQYLFQLNPSVEAILKYAYQLIYSTKYHEYFETSVYVEKFNGDYRYTYVLYIEIREINKDKVIANRKYLYI